MTVGLAAGSGQLHGLVGTPFFAAHYNHTGFVEQPHSTIGDEGALPNSATASNNDTG
eukprot:SAG31_NODE_204_length_20414_cov_19.143392_4_plen_57_part_00